MKKLTFIPILIAMVCFSFANPVGNLFPEMKVEKLDGSKISLPKDTKGKFTILCMAYSKKAEEDLKTWYKPLYNKFIQKPGKDDIFAFDVYDVNMYFVPMFTGVKQKASGNAKKKMKEGINKEFHDHILVFSGSLKDYKDVLGFEKKDEPYFFVLNEEGKVVYRTSGAYAHSKLDDIEDKIEPAD